MRMLKLHGNFSAALFVVSLVFILGVSVHTAKVYAFNVYDASGQNVVSVIPDEVYKARMDAWFAWVRSPRTVYAPGTTFADVSGAVVYYCPVFYFMGCVLPMDWYQHI